MKLSFFSIGVAAILSVFLCNNSNAYVLFGQSWPDSQATIYSTGGDSSSTFDSAFVEAMNNWNNLSDFQFINASGFCLFACGYAAMPTADYVSAVTGWDFNMAEGLKTGGRIQTLRHAFNMREGLRPTDFHLPRRMSEPSMVGQNASKQVDFNALRGSFFAAMGWDIESGWPLESTLQELQLTELVGPDRKKALSQAGRT